MEIKDKKFKIEALRFKYDNWKFFITNYLIFLAATAAVFLAKIKGINLELLKWYHLSIMIFLLTPLLYGYMNIWDLRRRILRMYSRK